LRVGNTNTGLDGWRGYIDHALLYNRALGADEVTSLYIEPFQMFRSVPIDLWTVAVGPPTAGNPWNYYAQAG
jgi:hypothetical protein